MKITLHKDKCFVCGMCVSIAPSLFSIESGVVTLIKDPKDYTDEDKNSARQAAQSCPNSVIEIIEDN